jgi:hypothetical protein
VYFPPFRLDLEAELLYRETEQISLRRKGSPCCVT